MSINKIDEMTERDAKALLNEICNEFGIGGKVRTHTTVMTNVSNAVRRSACLGRIETLYTETTTDEDGEETEEQLLNWGQEPDEYFETYKGVVGL